MAGHVRAHGEASPDRTTAPGPQSAAMIGVAPLSDPARSPPPAARRSCDPPPPAVQRIVLERPDTVGVTQHGCQVCCVLSEPCSRAGVISEIHPTLPGRFQSPLITLRATSIILLTAACWATGCRC